ncbi:acyl carrier protein [Phytomonospora endophytica]|uniref:Acyl carrier protein n=1 Tax=Phytomonospora endophytica TaxID=714109 RepID=A0A841FPT9_9ACTN|nr:acyl carrier protein [Phytomonospora endophytica]MBB6035572.1 acyl carrier protein [Phytomonospora endophytica]GIG70065.1 hypothetical protein Pen01_63600 [Phytomonospora endophytica]
MTGPTNDTSTELATWLAERVAFYLKIPAEGVDRNASFTALGLGSVHLICLAADVERRFERPVDSMLAWDHPTITAMATHLAG